jgi:hypothetical protein
LEFVKTNNMNRVSCNECHLISWKQFIFPIFGKWVLAKWSQDNFLNIVLVIFHWKFQFKSSLNAKDIGKFFLII